MAEPKGQVTPLTVLSTSVGASFGGQLIAATTRARSPGGNGNDPKFNIVGAGPEAWFGPLQPLAPMAPAGTGGRAFDYGFGRNLNYIPRAGLIPFEELRALGDTLPLLATVIENRKDRIASWNWAIQSKGGGRSNVRLVDKATQKEIERVTAFLNTPDQRQDFHTWLRPIIDDMLVIDAACIEPVRTRGGDLISLDVIDGSTIFPLIGADGRLPLPGQGPAYQQILHGIPAADFALDEIMYLPRNRRSRGVYGYCFGPGTEILTRDGWKAVSNLSYADQLATRHPITHEFQWQSPIALSARQFSGDLVKFSNGLGGIDVLVTPEHKMIVRDTVSGKESLMPAAELASKSTIQCRWKIPLATDSWNGVRIVEKVFANKATFARNVAVREMRAAGATYGQIASDLDCPVATVADVVNGRYAYDGRGAFKVDSLTGDNFCAFMGMYLSEGSINRGRMAVITQSKEPTREKFQRKLAECFGAVEYDGYDFRIHRTRVVEYVSQFGKSFEKFVPEEIMNATSGQIEIFLEYLFDGDAHRNRRGQTFFYTTSRRMADQVQDFVKRLVSQRRFARSRRAEA